MQGQASDFVGLDFGEKEHDTLHLRIAELNCSSHVAIWSFFSRKGAIVDLAVVFDAEAARAHTA